MKVSTKQSSKIECLKFLEPFIKKEWFKKLVCFVKRMRKNKIMRWVTNIAFIFIVMRIGLYYSYISAHTILEFPFWVWGIIPAIAIYVLLFVVGAKGKEVPFVLQNGNHKEINRWRQKESLRRTYLRRPDLLEKYQKTKEDYKLLDEIEAEEQK